MLLHPLLKPFLTASFMTTWVLVTMASTAFSVDYPAMKTHPAWSRGIQRVLGLNILSRAIATRVGEKVLRNELDGQLDLKLQSYSALDLLGRRLKHMELTGKNLTSKDIPTIYQLHVASDPKTPLWLDKKTNRLKRPVTFHVQATLTEADLNQYLKTAEAYNNLNFSVPIPPFKHHEVIKFSDAHIDLKPGKVMGYTVANIKGAPKSAGVTVNGTVTPNVNHGQLKMQRVTLRIPQIDKEYAQYLERFLEESLLQMIDMNTLVNIKHHRSRIAYRTVTIYDDHLNVSADLTISPKMP